jgi:hypothetical protein
MEEKKAEISSEIAVSSKDEMLEINKAILQTNREMAESLHYIKNHFRFELVVTIVKWFFFIALTIFGFISLSSILSGLGETYLSALSGNLK